MTRCRNIILRGKTILPDAVSSRVGRALDRVTGRVGISLPSIIGEPMLAPPMTDTVVIDNVESGVVTDGSLDLVEGLAPMNVARFADYATRVAKDPNAPIEKSPSLLVKGLRLFARPFDRLISGLAISAMPRLHFHGGTGPYSTSRLSLPLAGQHTPGVVSIDWHDLKGTASSMAETLANRLATSLAEHSTPNLSEVRIYIHSDGPRKVPKLSKQWTMVRGDIETPNERWYALNTERGIMVIDLFGMTSSLLSSYAEGFLTSEINSAYFDILGKSMGISQTIPLRDFFKNIGLRTRLLWEHKGTSLLLNEGVTSQTIRLSPSSPIRILPLEMPAIPKARFRMEILSPEDLPGLAPFFKTLPDLELRLSVSIPADDLELLNRELADTLNSYDYFADFGYHIARTLLDAHLKTLRQIAEGFKVLNLEVYLTRDCAGLRILEGQHDRSRVQIHLPLDRVKIESGAFGSHSESRVHYLLHQAIHHPDF